MLGFIASGAHFPRREGAPLGEEWNDKCEKWGCHLSSNSHKSPHVNKEEGTRAPPLKR
jgi:hypothetical protein